VFYGGSNLKFKFKVDKRQILFNWLKKAENKFITFGIFIATTAIVIPFLIIFFSGKKYDVKSFGEGLGPVGDFFGGTTVGLLSLASMIFVIAAIVMQKEELSLQREEVQKTRKEFEITNTTMKKQQFDSTFFNMINLHHNILKEIKIDSLSGREAIISLISKIKSTYNEEIYREFKERYIDQLNNYDLDQVNEITEIYFRALKKEKFSKENETLSFIDNIKFESDLSDFISSSLVEFEHKYKDNKINSINFFKTNLKYANYYRDLNIFLEAKHNFFERLIFEFEKEPLYDYKINTFERIYNNYENSIGHYYRNLYRIVRMIQDHIFSEDEEINLNEKKQYRGILRAQLSSSELLLIFYNVVYSKKGKRFKELLLNTNFFDDHLIIEDFIWNNDNKELEKLN